METGDMQEQLLDVIIIGGGPSGLCITARLLEDTPGWYSDREMDKINFWKRKTKKFSSSAKRKPRILAFDPSGQWMTRWNSLFKELGIKFLRSPVFFHMDPFDENSLLSFAQGREKEILSVDPLFESASSKKSKKRPQQMQFNYEQQWQFQRPGAKLFQDFTEDLISRYNLSEIIREGKVVSVDQCENDANEKPLFRVQLEDGRVFLAKAVVAAVGQQLRFPELKIKGKYPPQRILHALEPIRFSVQIYPNASNQRVLIVGGGLTSAQLALKAAEFGFRQVILVCRKGIKQKWFDLDLEWMGRYRSVEMDQFFRTSDPKEKWDRIKQARGGGSVTPEVLQELLRFSNSHEDVLSVQENVQIDSVIWTPLADDPELGHFEVTLNNHTTYYVDHLWCSTGMKREVESHPVFHDMNKRYPIQTVEGFPVLTEDLRWKEGVDFFVAGAFAAITLGPDAFNLIGGKRSAERIVSTLQEILSEHKGGFSEEEKEDIPLYFQNNVYSVLEVES